MALICEQIALSLITVLFACFISFYLHLTGNFNFWKKKLGIPVFDHPCLVISDLDLVKETQKFIGRSICVDEKVDPLSGKVMFVLREQRWRQVRVKVTPVFTSVKMKMMLHLVKICGKELM
jgi:hypothetical protein